MMKYLKYISVTTSNTDSGKGGGVQDSTSIQGSFGDVTKKFSLCYTSNCQLVSSQAKQETFQ